jgi:hypothetical protein
MTATTPATGKPPTNNGLAAVAFAFGIAATYAILQYSINNLDVLGLAPEIKKVRSLEIYIFVFGHVFIFFMLGRIAYTHPEWAFKLGVLGVAIALFDFAGTYQARLGITQQQTMTQTAQKAHARMLEEQAKTSQSAAQQLQESAARQLRNKHITGSAGTAKEAAKQADAGVEMVKEHAKTLEAIRPTEQDTWGEWTGTKVFIGASLLHLFNLAMWGVAGALSAGQGQRAASTPAPIAAPEPRNTAPSTFATRAAAAGVVGGAAAMGGMPAYAETPPQAPQMTVKYGGSIPTAATAQRTETATPSHTEIGTTGVAKSVRKQYAKAAGRQMDTGTEGKASVRYERVKALVRSRTVNPSINALYRIPDEHISKDTAKDYMQAMEKEGVVVKDGRGWKVVTA